MSTTRLPGRGTDLEPPNRFDGLHLLRDDLDQERRSQIDQGLEPIAPAVATTFQRDTSRTILAENSSPDVGFRFSLNPYRGCEHGCIYCYARPTHEMLGWNAGIDFETRIRVKEDAPFLLRRKFLSPRWEPQTVALSGNTDCYQPVERQLRLTRRCLEVFAEFRNPVGIVTKSALVARDADLLASLARRHAANVRISITSLDPMIARRMEPRAPSPERRLEAIRRLAEAGVPTAVMVAPVVPGLTDEEMPRILEAAAAAGARSASWILVRLPHAVEEIFIDWLGRHFPDRRDRVLHRIRECRGGTGRLSDATFGQRMRGQGEYARQLAALFAASARRHHLDSPLPALDASAFRRPPSAGDQLALL